MPEILVKHFTIQITQKSAATGLFIVHLHNGNINTNCTSLALRLAANQTYVSANIHRKPPTERKVLCVVNCAESLVLREVWKFSAGAPVAVAHSVSDMFFSFPTKSLFFLPS